MTLALPAISRRIVGRAAVMRVSSVIRPSSRGTLKSTRTNTRAPERSRRSSTVFFAKAALGGGAVALGHQVDEVLHPVGEAPLVVVPGEDLQEVPAHDLGERRVHDRRRGVAAVVDGDELLVGDPRMPFIRPAAALRKAPFTSSALAGLLSSTVRSTMETFGVGTRMAIPSSLPFSSGIDEVDGLGRAGARSGSWTAPPRAPAAGPCGAGRGSSGRWCRSGWSSSAP